MIKEFLNIGFKLNKALESKKMEIMNYKELSKSIGISKLGEKVNSTYKKEAFFEKYVNKIEELEKEILSLECKIEKFNIRIATFIESLDNINQKMVITYRSMLLYTWEEIAIKMNYSKRWIIKLYEMGVNELENKINHKNSIKFTVDSI